MRGRNVFRPFDKKLVTSDTTSPKEGRLGHCAIEDYDSLNLVKVILKITLGHVILSSCPGVPPVHGSYFIVCGLGGIQTFTQSKKNKKKQTDHLHTSPGIVYVLKVGISKYTAHKIQYAA